MENGMKECEFGLFAHRISASSTRIDQLRLWFASLAYVLLCALRGSTSRLPTCHCHPGTLRLLKPRRTPKRWPDRRPGEKTSVRQCLVHHALQQIRPTMSSTLTASSCGHRAHRSHAWMK